MAFDELDIVTRFVFGRHNIKRRENHYGISEIIVQPEAFEPERKRNDLSVSKITDLRLLSDERSIWFLGKFVEQERQRGGSPSNLYGRADLSVSQIRDLNLDVVHSDPPPRHANIKNFPSSSTESDFECFYVQQKLADRAERFLSKEVVPEITDILNEDVRVKPEFSEGFSIN
jgi:hypothetical protein